MPSPVVCLSSASRCPEPSPPSCQPRAHQFLEDVAVADLGANQLDAALAQRQLDGHVGHQRADHAAHRLALREAVEDHHVEQLVAVVEAPLGIDILQAVGIAVERDAAVGPLRQDCRDQRSAARSRRSRR